MDADTNHTVLDREKAGSREGSNYHFWWTAYSHFDAGCVNM